MRVYAFHSAAPPTLHLSHCLPASLSFSESLSASLPAFYLSTMFKPLLLRSVKEADANVQVL